MSTGKLAFRASVWVGILLLPGVALAQQQAPDTPAEVKRQAEQLVERFNAGDVPGVTNLFLPTGELVDENGTVYQGQQEIHDLLSAFFANFSDAKLSLNIESIRAAGPILIDEGTRTITAADGTQQAHLRYIAVWANTADGWKIASFRDFLDESAPSAHAHLQPLSWLVGDWLNEGIDGKVQISYRWSDDGNFLLGEFAMSPNRGEPRKSQQRIGWDPAAGKIRSWLFDADGGFSEGVWTILEDGIIIKSESVNPGGTAATVTLQIIPESADRYTLVGTDRVIGDSLEEDFEITITRQPPAAGNRGERQ